MVRGPQEAEALARGLLAHKADVFTTLEHRSENFCHFCGETVDRRKADWGAWTDGQTVFGASVHIRCFNIMFPDGPRGPVNDDVEREAIQAEGCGELG